MGIDRAITSLKREDYVELACRLLSDPQMYREWSEHSKKQYEKYADVASYVKNFESIIRNALEEKQVTKKNNIICRIAFGGGRKGRNLYSGLLYPAAEGDPADHVFSASGVFYATAISNL